ncbi:alpha/beta hydrolase [Verrucomicrobiaceae bacterium R5-34]|nr:alpha/beta hydrolase [Verrucomicrobiaceae bacterium R5-34]
MKTLLKSSCVLLLSSLTWAVAAPDTTSDAAPKTPKKVKKRAPYLETGAERKLDVVYKKVGKKELQLDLYYPTAKQSATPPVIIYTHGGGWAAGSRRGITSGRFAKVFTQLLAEGFCVATVDYRLYSKDGDVLMRDCVIDSKDALRYLSQHSKTLKIDPSRFHVMGDSAGGQIAQMLLLSKPESLPGDPSLAEADYHVVSGVSWYGPCDFEKTELFNHDDRPNFRDRFGPRIIKPGTDPKEKLQLYREMSPINYLKKDSPPLLMIQGDKDTTIPVKHAYYMKKKAEQLQAPVEIMIIQNAGHNWRKVDAEIEPGVNDIIQKTVQFFLEAEPSHSTSK